MNQKEIILKQLRSMGFEPEEEEGLGYVFKYDEMSLLYMPDDDENFLRIIIPNIYDVTDENRVAVLEAMQETSCIVKYTKVNIMYESLVWAVYEHYLVSEENLEDLIEHMVRALMATVAVFHKKVNGDEIEAELDKLLEGIDENGNQ